MKLIITYSIFVIFSVCIIIGPGSAHAKIIYADNHLTENCVNNNYSIQKRDGSGSDGNAYKSVQEAIDAMSVGDTVMMRKGVYKEGHIRIDYRKSGTSWAKDEYNTLMSYPGEWAVLDGENGGGDGGYNGLTVGAANSGTGCVLGHSTYPSRGQSHMKYWKFERFEIRNGASADGNYAAGFWGTAGPFIFSHLYIHDNMASSISNNPAGIKGHVWHDSKVEYCYFINNGADSTHHNSAHLCIYSDYNPNGIAKSGFVDYGHHTMRNEICYNLFQGGTVAIKYKQDQLFSFRDASAGLPDDTYKTYGDKVHHNIILNTIGQAIDARQDFIQVYNNILDSCASAIGVGEIDTRSIYKAVLYNNTIMNSTDWGIFRVHSWWSDYSLSTQTLKYFGYDYNNILDQVRDGWNWSDIGVDTYGSYNNLTPDYSNYKVDRNLFNRPKTNNNDSDGSNLVYIGDSNYRLGDGDISGAILKKFDSASLFVGSTGSDKYKINPSFVFSGSMSVSNAGITKHPYLDFTLPKYIGASNPAKDTGTSWDPSNPDPDDAAWVDYVLSMAIIGTKVENVRTVD